MPRAGLRLLGGFELTDKDGATVALTSRKGRALLAYLALSPDRHHGRGELAALLWGGRGEAQARGSLNQSLQVLRKAIGDRDGELFATDRDGVTLHGEAIEVDVARLRRLAASDEIEDLAAAARLYEGELLAGFATAEAAYEDWLQVERENTLGTVVEGLSRLAERLLEGGDGAAAVAPAEKLAALDPLGEPAHRLLMRAYNHAGRRSAALEQYQTLVKLLEQELGVEPEAETKALFEAIMKQDDGEERLAGSASAAPDPTPERDEGGPQEHPTLPEKPSIAVLPFENMSGVGEQEYFADGIAEDIITALSKYRWFFVSARNSSFTYKGQAVDIGRVGRELGVRYVLEGSVRKAGDRVRVTAQLIEAESDNHIWAERYDRELADIFELQDEIQQAIVTAVEPELASAEHDRASRKTPRNLDAWDFCRQGLWHLNQRTGEDNEKAGPLFEMALQLDPSMARAYAGLARIRLNAVKFGWRDDWEPSFERERELAGEAVRRDDRDPFTHDALGRALAYSGEIEAAIGEHRIALDLNPNSAFSAWVLGEMLMVTGRHEEALEYLDLALRLSPRDPNLFSFVSFRAVCLDFLGRSEEAEAAHLRAIALRSSVYWPHVFLADFYARHGRPDEARASVAAALQRFPDLTCARMRNAVNPIVRSFGEDFFTRMHDAGVPEPETKAPQNAAEKQADGDAGEAHAAITGKPSIAVLPFENMSGDPEQEYFGDGIAEDIITALSRLRWFLVIARNSTFVYKGRSVDVKEVGRELGVRYVLEGSVRRAGNRVRIAAQLVDAKTGAHHWAQNFDRDLDDIFELQDDITQSVTAAIEPKLVAAEGARSQSRSPQDLSAWELVARAMEHYGRMTTSESETAIKLLRSAVQRYPDYGPAHSLLAFTLLMSGHMGWIPDSDDYNDAAELARRAAQLDNEDPWAHLALGYLAFTIRRTDEAVRACKKALELNPNFATAHGSLGRVLAFDGRSDEAIRYLELALRLSPHDPMKAQLYGCMSVAHYQAFRYVEAVEWARKLTEERPGRPGGWRILCASLAQAGRSEEAKEAMATLRKLQPNLSIAWIEQHVPYTERAMPHFIEGMRKAGSRE